MLFDRTRLSAIWTLRFEGRTARLDLETRGIRVIGRGEGRVDGGTLALDVDWRAPEKHCAGTMHLTGAAANGGATLVGEIDYLDGCDENRRKPGTFALWRGPRNVSSLAHP